MVKGIVQWQAIIILLGFPDVIIILFFNFIPMNNFLKKLYAFMALLTLLMGSISSWVTYAAIPPLFTDIDTSFAKSDIEAFALRGIVEWYTDGSFRPNYTITRAEFVAITMKALNISVSGISGTHFRDIPSGEGAWIIPYAERARQLGIIYGQTIWGVLKFRPNDSITRAEAIIILLRAAKIPVDSSVKTTVFQDVSAYAWWVLTPYVERARQLGIIHGQVLQWVLKFRPNNSITRAESVKIIMEASSL